MPSHRHANHHAFTSDHPDALAAHGPLFQGDAGMVFFQHAAPYTADYRLGADQIQLHLSRYRAVTAVGSDRWTLEETIGAAASVLPAGADYRDRPDPAALSDHVAILLPERRLEAALDAAGERPVAPADAWGLTCDRLAALGRHLRAAMLFGARRGYDAHDLDGMVDETVVEVAGSLARTAATGVKVHKGGLTRAQLKRVTSYVEAHLAGPVPLAGMAAEAGLSRFHFARQFKATVGVSPYEHVLEQRLGKARELLATSTDGIAGIARASGFADHAHLTNHFRKRLGVGPADYRRLVS